MGETVRWIDVVWTDLIGRAHVVKTPADLLRTTGAERRTLKIASAEVVAGFDTDLQPAGDEVWLVPDWSTERTIPWDGENSVVVADLYDEHGPSPICPRGFLRQAVDAAAGIDVEVSAAVELEFFLVNPDTGRPVYDWVDNYALSQVEYEPVVEAIRNELRAMAVQVEASNPEYSGGQFEVNISRAPLLSAADQGVLLRLYARALGRRYGLDATFLPKPWTEESGSGAHFHQSLWRNASNVLFGGEDTLSAEGRGYLAGLLQAMPDLALIGSPTPNGFHRRADGSFAPTAVSWATDNRTAGVRVVFGGPRATRIEYRDGAADCNFYLALGSQVLSGLDGLKRKLEPPPPITGNGYAMPDLPLVPRTFLEAYERFRDSELIARIVPAPLREAYLTTLEPEVEQVVVRSADWERERYADVPLR